jgi:amidase
MASPEIVALASPSKTAHPSVVGIQEKKKAEQLAHLARYPDWQLKRPLPSGVTDVTAHAHAALSKEEQEIVVQDGVSLRHAFITGRYTAVEVAKAVFHAATIAHQMTNCLTEIFFDEGLARAEDLDRHFQRTGTLVGPLHGIPISIKDALAVQGHDTSAGYVGFAFNTCAEKDAVIVQMLRKAGAVLFAKTANPQTLMVSCSCVLFYSMVLNGLVIVFGNQQQHIRSNIEPIQCVLNAGRQ